MIVLQVIYRKRGDDTVRRQDDTAIRPGGRGPRSRSEPDPFDVEPTSFSRREIRCLIERGALDPGEVSPLAAFALGYPPLSPAEREAAVQKLRLKGVLRDPSGTVRFPPGARRSAYGAPLRRALEILARPEARLRIGVATPQRPPARVQLFAAGGDAALGVAEGDRFHAGPPIAKLDLGAALLRNLHFEHRTGDEPAIGLWPFVVDLVRRVWPRGRPRPQVRSRALAELARDEGDPDVAARLLEGLIKAGVVEERGGLVALTAPYAPWLDALLSGHGVEVEYSLLAPTVGESDRLLFVGPPDRRVLFGTLEHSEMGPPANGSAPAVARGSDEVLLLARLSDEALALRLRELLHL
jgi:hypothetical protein